MDERALRMPGGLEAAGQALWRSVVLKYVLEPDEAVVLEAACRQVDECARMTKELARMKSLVVAGSVGQPKVHPLVAQVRTHRMALDKLLGPLLARLRQADEEARPRAALRPRSAQASKAAQTRWARTAELREWRRRGISPPA
jgi:hypothetical protein